MNNTDNAAGSWERIQSGVRETERLLGQKRYNMAMVKSRQTVEFMVKCLCDRNGVTETGLADMIDALYAEGFIKKTTCEHYHKIRTIGNKAIHEEHNSAYDANQAHHLLSQEVYTFANDYTGKRRKIPDRSEPVRTASNRSSSQNRQGRSGRPGRPAGRSSRRRGSAPKRGFQLADVVRILIPLVIILLLIFIIRIIAAGMDGKETTEESTIPTSVTEVTVATSPDVEQTPEEPTTTVAPVVSYKTTATLNVRSKPSTDSSILTQLPPDTAIEFVKDHDDKWAEITYDGQKAYVSKEFIQEVSE